MANEKLGILVTSNKHIHHLIGISKAAKKSNKAVYLFLTHNGVLVTQDPKYPELAELGIVDISLCNVRWEELGLQNAPLPKGMGLSNMATQSRHVSMIETCDHYLVL